MTDKRGFLFFFTAYLRVACVHYLGYDHATFQFPEHPWKVYVLRFSRDEWKAFQQATLFLVKFYLLNGI